MTGLTDGSAQAESTVRQLPAGPSPRTRDRILAAGIACCAALGSDRVTMQDVADRSCFSRKTIYRYFRDRDDLFLAIDHYERHLENSEIAARLAQDATLQDAIRVVIEVHLERVLGLYRLREHFKNDRRRLLPLVVHQALRPGRRHPQDPRRPRPNRPGER